MDTNYKICCLTGHRPGGFPWDYNDKTCAEHHEYLTALRDMVLDLINNQGYNYFISGGAIGADQDFAELIIELRDTVYPHIKLEIAVPCPNQDLKWNAADKARYKNIIDHADFVNLISPRYSTFCMSKRNEYMVNKSSFVICVWNGQRKGGTFSTLRYAEKKKVELGPIEIDEMTAESKEFAKFMKSVLQYGYDTDPEWRAKMDKWHDECEEWKKNNKS